MYLRMIEKEFRSPYIWGLKIDFNCHSKHVDRWTETKMGFGRDPRNLDCWMALLQKCGCNSLVHVH